MLSMKSNMNSNARAIADSLLFSVEHNLSFDEISNDKWTTYETRLDLLKILENYLALMQPEHKQRILEWIERKEDEYRASVEELIANGHAEDQRRVRNGELHPDSMFFISRERAKEMTVIWNNDPSLFDKL